MAQTELTVNEIIESMTGREELATAQYFSHTFADLAENNPSMFTRALIFVVKMREGLDAIAAGDFALDLMLKDVNAFFSAPSEAEAGKDKQPATLLNTSPSSASSPAEPSLSTSS